MSCGFRQEGDPQGGRRKGGGGGRSPARWEGDIRAPLGLCLILQMDTLARVSAPCDVLRTCVASKAMDSPIPCLLPVRMYLTWHQQPLILPGLGHLPFWAACGEAPAAVAHSREKEG